ncbi:MAG: hypothetical protein ACP5GE_06430, partial [Thermoplasmata archaeon]
IKKDQGLPYSGKKHLITFLCLDEYMGRKEMQRSCSIEEFFGIRYFFSTEDFQVFEELAKNFIMKTFILNEGEM